MRLLHLAPSDPDSSGIARYAARFRHALEEEGVTASLAWEGAQPRDVPGIRRYAAAARWAAAGADIVHAELGGESLADFYATRALLSDGTAPVCVTLHDPPRAVWAPFAVSPLSRSRGLAAAARWLVAPVARGLEQGTISRVPEIFVLSASGAAALSRSATVLPFPVDGSPPDNRIEKFAPDALTVAFFGHWYRGKGVELLVRVAGQLRREGRAVNLRLWGTPLASSTGAAGYRDRVLALARELGLGDSFEAGALPEEQVTPALRSCDAVVLPYERPRRLRKLASASASMVEALAAGTPVVTSEMRGFSDFIRSGDNGLFIRPGDIDGLARCLRRLHDDLALRTDLRDGAIRTALAMRERKPGMVAAARYQELLARDPRTSIRRVGMTYSQEPI